MAKSKRSRGKADRIQPLGDEAARLIGAGWIACSPYAKLGFDRIYAYGGGLYIIEWKSTARAKLTKQELARQRWCIKFNIFYGIAHSVEEFLAYLGIRKEVSDRVIATLRERGLLT